MQQIEGEFGLWEKKVPKVGWKCSIDAGQDCQEEGEGSTGLVSRINEVLPLLNTFSFCTCCMN